MDMRTKIKADLVAHCDNDGGIIPSKSFVRFANELMGSEVFNLSFCSSMPANDVIDYVLNTIVTHLIKKRLDVLKQVSLICGDDLEKIRENFTTLFSCIPYFENELNLQEFELAKGISVYKKYLPDDIALKTKKDEGAVSGE